MIADAVGIGKGTIYKHFKSKAEIYLRLMLDYERDLAARVGDWLAALHGRGARDLKPGERVWFRHAKAGELCERVNELHLVANGEIVGTVPTYRGEGKAFL